MYLSHLTCTSSTGAFILLSHDPVHKRWIFGGYDNLGSPCNDLFRYNVQTRYAWFTAHHSTLFLTSYHGMAMAMAMTVTHMLMIVYGVVSLPQQPIVHHYVIHMRHS
jgi:hypothetical protein